MYNITKSHTPSPSSLHTHAGTTTDFSGCLEVDDVWSITWPNTLLDHHSIQPCPNPNGRHVMGNTIVQYALLNTSIMRNI